MTQTVTLEGLRGQVKTSVHGRRLGLDNNDYVVGPKGLRDPIKAFTAITGTLNAYGINSIGVSTAAPTYTMPSPVPGAIAKLVFTTTAVTTLAVTINATTGTYFQASGGSTMQTITVSTTSVGYMGAIMTLEGMGLLKNFLEM